jgi:SAM-dependent methyltransferase
VKPLGPRRPKPGVDRALEVGSKAHYDDPAYYSKTYAGRTDDVDFYRRVARESGGPGLEYGIGNGRIAVPIAQDGVNIHGVDLSAPMLADLGRRLAKLPAEVSRRVSSTHGDMREVRLKQKFPLVLSTFNTFLHLYTRDDVAQFLDAVKHHLAPGGTFIVDVAVPQHLDLARDPNRAYSAPRFKDPSTGKLVKYAERFDYDCARQILFVTMEFTPLDGSDPWVVPLTHRQFFPQELEALFHYNGFVVQSVLGSFEGESLSRFSDVSVWTCTLRK